MNGSGKNLVALTGGLVADPEVHKDTVVSMRLGVDYAGSDSESKGLGSGYFDLTYYLDDNDPNSQFVKRQLEAGNLKKGSQVSVAGSLRQKRWKDSNSGQSRQNVVIIVDDLTYAGGGRNTEGTSNTSSEDAPTSQAVVDVPTQF